MAGGAGLLLQPDAVIIAAASSQRVDRIFGDPFQGIGLGLQPGVVRAAAGGGDGIGRAVTRGDVSQAVVDDALRGLMA